MFVLYATYGLSISKNHIGMTKTIILISLILIVRKHIKSHKSINITTPTLQRIYKN